MSLEISIPATEAPHYMARLVFSRVGDTARIEVVDERGYQKALYEHDATQFVEAMAAIGLVKVIAT